MAAPYFQREPEIKDKFGVEAVKALLSGNPGTSAPSSPYINMLWTDTNTPTNPILKQYNGSSWLTV